MSCITYITTTPDNVAPKRTLRLGRNQRRRRSQTNVVFHCFFFLLLLFCFCCFCSLYFLYYLVETCAYRILLQCVSSRVNLDRLLFRFIFCILYGSGLEWLAGWLTGWLAVLLLLFCRSPTSSRILPLCETFVSAKSNLFIFNNNNTSINGNIVLRK